MSKNPNVPAIPVPTADLVGLTNIAISMRQGIQSLSGQTGPAASRAVTFNDLVALGLVTTAQIATVA